MTDHEKDRPRIRVQDKRLGARPDASSDAPSPTDAPSSSDAAAAPSAAEELAEAQKLADERLDQLMRLKADFENYRRRVIREQTDLVERASLRIVERLLPVLDDLERALEAARLHKPGGPGGAVSGAPESTGPSLVPQVERGAESSGAPRSQLDAIVRGIELVYRHLHEVLLDEGLERVEAEGAFDPQEHEAVSSVTGGVAEPTILEIVRPGYKLKGKTIRPALVHVSVPEEPLPEEAPEEGGE